MHVEQLEITEENNYRYKGGPLPKSHCTRGHAYVEGSYLQCYALDGTKNGKKCRLCVNERYEETSNNRKTKKDQHYFLRYGILNLNERDRILESQGNACSICGNTGCEWKKGFHNTWHVDHDHNNPLPNYRSILCSNCNHTLGRMNDDVDYAQKFVDYLTYHKNK